MINNMHLTTEDVRVAFCYFLGKYKIRVNDYYKLAIHSSDNYNENFIIKFIISRENYIVGVSRNDLTTNITKHQKIKIFNAAKEMREFNINEVLK